MTYIILAVLGLCFGSFIHAVMWRLHARRDFVKERSECEHCKHQLAWYDLLPVVSWLMLRGRCRYCHRPIGVQHPLIELLTAGLFVGSYIVWPFGFETVGVALFGLWLVAIVMLVGLAIYDMRWMLLPDVVVFPLIAIGIAFGLLRWMGVENLAAGAALLEVLYGIASIAGVYLLLYVASRGAWVGFGDVKLGVFMGAVLGWQFGLVALVLANLIGCLVVVPGLLLRRITARSRVPFGPFLIAGFIIAGLFGRQIVDWYLWVSGVGYLLG